MFNFLRKRSHEKKFYEKLFIKSAHWNTPWPNHEELLRWTIIRNYIEQDIIADLKTHNRAGFDILDVGSGRGWLSSLCTPYGQVKAIEPVKKVAAYGKKLYPFLDISSEKPETLIKKGYRYNLVICSEVIEHIPDNQKKQFAKRLEQLLKPGGYIVLTTPRSEVLEEWTQYIAPGQPVEDWMSETQVEALFAHLGQVRKKHLAIRPAEHAPEIPVYQIHLFCNV